MWPSGFAHPVSGSFASFWCLNKSPFLGSPIEPFKRLSRQAKREIIARILITYRTGYLNHQLLTLDPGFPVKGDRHGI